MNEKWSDEQLRKYEAMIRIQMQLDLLDATRHLESGDYETAYRLSSGIKKFREKYPESGNNGTRAREAPPNSWGCYS